MISISTEDLNVSAYCTCKTLSLQYNSAETVYSSMARMKISYLFSAGVLLFLTSGLLQGQPLGRVIAEIDSLSQVISNVEKDSLSAPDKLQSLRDRLSTLETERVRVARIYDFFNSKLVKLEAAEQVNLRESPRISGPVSQTIPDGEYITVHGYDEGNNRYITTSGISNTLLYALPLAFYVPDSLYFGQGRFGSERPPNRKPVPATTSTRRSTETSTVRRPAAAVQCKAFTEKGSRCKNTTKDSSGYCHLHKK